MPIYHWFRSKDEIVPCSDAACEIVKLGSNVVNFKVGDRVCANFELDRIAGDANELTQKTALGGAVDGMLTQYRILPAHVRITLLLVYQVLTVAFPKEFGESS